MARPSKSSTVPLHCILCPKQPTFSDISHLLTHVSSKGHLSYQFRLGIKATSEPQSQTTLDNYNAWYERHGVKDLLADRMASKDLRNGVKARRATQQAKKKDTDSLQINEPFGPGPDPIGHRGMHGLPIRPPPKMHIWSTGPTESDENSINANINRWDTRNPFETPTMQRSVPGFTDERDSGEHDATPVPDAPLTMADIEGHRSVLDDEPSLKGVQHPGMGLFDAATADMRKKRNQRKDGTILAQMRRTSRDVEPNIVVYDLTGQFMRSRDIYDDTEEELELPSSERTPSPKRRRGRKPKVLKDISVNVRAPASRGKSGTGRKPGRPKGSKNLSEYRPRETPSLGLSNHGMSRPGLPAFGNALSLNNEVQEEFRMTIDNIRKKSRMRVFEDGMAKSPNKSPGRTESPVEDHRYEHLFDRPMEQPQLSRFLPPISLMKPHDSNRITGNPIQGSIHNRFGSTSLRFGNQENLEPDYLMRRTDLDVGGYATNVFHHNHNGNPLARDFAYNSGFDAGPYTTTSNFDVDDPEHHDFKEDGLHVQGHYTNDGTHHPFSHEFSSNSAFYGL